MRAPLWPRAIVIACVVFLAASCGGAVASGPPSASVAALASPSAAATVLWPAPSDPLARIVAAGLQPLKDETGTNHVHAHLDVFVDGKPIVVPAGIGININDPDVRTFDEADGSVSYGGIEVCAKPCISPLHTHFATGILHTESASSKPNTLGEFFVEWGVDLSETCVGTFCKPKEIAIHVDGEPWAGDPRAIELTDRRQIAIVIGTPPPVIPKTADFSKD